MKTQASLMHFQLNVEYLMFNIVGKTEIGLASEDEGPVIGLLWLKWFIAMTFFFQDMQLLWGRWPPDL